MAAVFITRSGVKELVNSPNGFGMQNGSIVNGCPLCSDGNDLQVLTMTSCSAAPDRKGNDRKNRKSQISPIVQEVLEVHESRLNTNCSLPR